MDIRDIDPEKEYKVQLSVTINQSTLKILDEQDANRSYMIRTLLKEALLARGKKDNPPVIERNDSYHVTEKDAEIMLDMWLEGKTLEKIAEATKFSVATVRKWCIRFEEMGSFPKKAKTRDEIITEVLKKKGFLCMD